MLVCKRSNGTGSLDPVELAFMIDCTSSMGPHIIAAKDSINKVIDEVKQDGNIKLKVAIVAYTDNAVGTPNRFKTLPFTDNSDSAKTYLQKHCV